MKPLQKLNNFAEKHWYYHKEVGNGKAIFYYRSSAGLRDSLFNKEKSDQIQNLISSSLLLFLKVG